MVQTISVLSTAALRNFSRISPWASSVWGLGRVKTQTIIARVEHIGRAAHHETIWDILSATGETAHQ
jgi:hypothetical protein